VVENLRVFRHVGFFCWVATSRAADANHLAGVQGPAIAGESHWLKETLR
jgi:hypothetical protein